MNFHLVIRIHFGHHSFFQKVKGQHLQHVKLVRHFCFDWSISSNDVLRNKDDDQYVRNKVSIYGQNRSNIAAENSVTGIPVSSDIRADQTVQIKHFQTSWCQEKSLSEQSLFHFTVHKSHHICWFCDRALRVCKCFSFWTILGFQHPPEHQRRTDSRRTTTVQVDANCINNF